MTRRFLLACLAALTLAVAADAQTRVSGRLRDAGDGTSVANASVALLDDRGRFQMQTESDQNGIFVLEGIRPGRFQIRASRVGYQETSSAILTLARNDTLVMDVQLSSAEVLLAPVAVVARSARRSAMLRSFYQRMDTGLGTYMTREQIERRGAVAASDLLIGFAGLRPGNSTYGIGRQLYNRRGCLVPIFVDGILVNRGGGTVDEVVDPSVVEGIEVYRGNSDTPAQFSFFGGAPCGAVAIWTRRGYQS